MDLIQSLAAVVLVMALLGGVLVLLKRRGIATFPQRGARNLEVLDRIALTTQHSIHLVRAQNRTILIATAPGVCQLLDSDCEFGVREEKSL